MKSLREICSEMDISRRTIQGYEKAGIVKATKKNKYGRLLYDQLARERIRRTRFLQEIGFAIKDIKSIIDMPDEMVIPILEEQIRKCERDLEHKQVIIQQARGLLEELKSNSKCI